jgi:hypothetical protein
LCVAAILIPDEKWVMRTLAVWDEMQRKQE